MLGQTFYHQTIRKYVTLFGTLFNDINIEKKNSSGSVVSRQKVPIAYGPKQKFLQRIRQDANLDRSVAIQLPRMAFEMTGMSYDPVRKLNSIGNISYRSTNNTVSKMYNPTPYLFDFSLFIFVDNAEDGTQILEQILPFFTPEFNTTINVLTDMGIKLDVPIIINGASSEDSYEGDLSARRTIVWTVGFTLKGFIYPSIKTGQNIIKSIDVAFRLMDDSSTADSELNKLVLESSTNYSESFVRLETGDHFLLETSDTKLGLDNIISKITITPEGGKNVEINIGDSFDANTQITIFNPSVDYDPDTDTYG